MSEPKTPQVSAAELKKKQEAKRKKEYEANRQALDELCELYPDVFDRSSPKPLQIGIHEAVAADGKLSKTRIRRALNLYVRMRRYIASLVEDAERITLGGEVTGKVSAEEAKHAIEKLKEIDQKRAQKKPTTQKPKGPRKNTRKPSTTNANRKPNNAPAPKAKVIENPKDQEDRFKAKLEALVNKKTN